MFGRKKREIPRQQRQSRASIIHEALALIAVANKAEAASLESGDAESTDTQELSRAKEVLEAQSALTERIVLSQTTGLTMKQISKELIQPVLDRSVVGDVAHLALGHAIRSAQSKMVSN